MEMIIEWANQNTGFLSLLFAAVVASAAIVTVFLNQALVRETVALRKAETEPDLAVYLDVPNDRQSFFDLVIKNIGRGSAYTVSLSLDRTWSGHDSAYIGNMSIFQDGIKYLPPDQELRSFVGTYHDLDHGPLRIDVTYHGKSGGKELFTETFSLDVQQFEGTMSLGGSPDEEMVRAVKEIARDFRSLKSGTWTPAIQINGFRPFRQKRRLMGRRQSKMQRFREWLKPIIDFLRSTLRGVRQTAKSLRSRTSDDTSIQTQ